MKRSRNVLFMISWPNSLSPFSFLKQRPAVVTSALSKNNGCDSHRSTGSHNSKPNLKLQKSSVHTISTESIMSPRTAALSTDLLNVLSNNKTQANI